MRSNIGSTVTSGIGSLASTVIALKQQRAISGNRKKTDQQISAVSEKNRVDWVRAELPEKDNLYASGEAYENNNRAFKHEVSSKFTKDYIDESVEKYGPAASDFLNKEFQEIQTKWQNSAALQQEKENQLAAALFFIPDEGTSPEQAAGMEAVNDETFQAYENLNNRLWTTEDMAQYMTPAEAVIRDLLNEDPDSEEEV